MGQRKPAFRFLDMYSQRASLATRLEVGLDGCSVFVYLLCYYETSACIQNLVVSQCSRNGMVGMAL